MCHSECHSVVPIPDIAVHLGVLLPNCSWRRFFVFGAFLSPKYLENFVLLVELLNWKSVGDQLSMVASKIPLKTGWYILLVGGACWISAQQTKIIHTTTVVVRNMFTNSYISSTSHGPGSGTKLPPPELQAWAIQWKDSQRWHGWNLSCRQMVGFPPPRLSLKVCVHAILRRHLVPPAVLNEVVWWGKIL